MCSKNKSKSKHLYKENLIGKKKPKLNEDYEDIIRKTQKT